MAIGAILAGAGTALSIYGQYQQGKMAAVMGRMRKQYAEKAAKETIASGQRAMLEERRNAELLASRAIAVAAASGAAGQSVDKIIADIKGEGAYREAVAMYDAEEKAKKIIFEGEMAQFGGEAQQKASRYGMLGTALSGGASMYSQLNKPPRGSYG